MQTTPTSLRAGAMGLLLVLGVALAWGDAHEGVSADERTDAAATPILEVTIDTVTGGVGGWIRSLEFKRFSVLRGDPLR